MICVGNNDPGFGLTNAFLMNAAVISKYVPAKVIGFHDQLPQNCGDIYVHGLPAQIENFFQANLVQVSQNRVVAYLVCESTQLQSEYEYIFQFIDEIWTASNFCADVYRRYFNRPVHVVPHVLDRLAHVRYGMPSEHTLLSVFDGGSRILRKNPVLLAEGFAEELGGSKNVQLLIKAKNVNPTLVSYLSSLAENIVVMDCYLDESALQLLYTHSTGYVSLHAAEGFGLTVLEAMSHGLPCIATDWSGTTDFFNESCGLPVKYSLAPVDDQFFRGMWAYPDKEDYKKKLRQFVELGEEDWMRMSKAACEQACKFDLKCLERKIKNLL